MSDTVVVMDKGRIQQIGTPEDIYNEPKNAFVADFIGESNIIRGTMLKDLLVKFSDREFVCLDSGFDVNAPVDVVVRPEDIVMTSPEQGMLRGIVKSVVFYGMHYEMTVESAAKDGFCWLIQNIKYAEVGAEIGMNIEPDAIHIMKKSEYSGMFGDYSSFSNELDQLSVVEESEDE